MNQFVTQTWFSWDGMTWQTEKMFPKGFHFHKTLILNVEGEKKQKKV